MNVGPRVARGTLGHFCNSVSHTVTLVATPTY
jgi:hypothetical protein